MGQTRHVSLSVEGKDQILTIPQDFALANTDVMLRKEGERLIIEPIAPNSLLSVLSQLSDIEEEFPDVDEGLLPIDDLSL